MADCDCLIVEEQLNQEVHLEESTLSTMAVVNSNVFITLFVSLLLVKLTGQTCPTWFVPRAQPGSCVCGPTFKNILKCNQSSNEIMLSSGYCMTYNQNQSQEYFGRCPYNTNSVLFTFTTVPSNVSKLNEEMCGPLNRTGMLCSDCQTGLGPTVFSFTRECKKCMKYPFGWLLFFVRLTVPLTLFCILVIVFQVNVASPSLNGFIFVSQIISCAFSANSYIVSKLTNDYSLLKFGADFYSFFNLDFFPYLIPSFCISEGMSMPAVFLLEYCTALYPILFALVVYLFIYLHDKGCKIVVICWRPFHRCSARFRKNWDLKGSVVNAFATFILFSYCKFISISISLTKRVIIWDSTGESMSRLYFSVNYNLHVTKYKIIVGFSALVILFMVLLPALFLLFYQCRFFQRCLFHCKVKCVLVHELANIAQGSFKNGTTPGTRDLRWFAGLYLFLRFILIYIINQQHQELYYLCIFAFMAVIVAGLRPYRIDKFNNLDSVFWLLCAFSMSWFLNIMAYNDAWKGIFEILVYIPLVYFIAMVFWKILSLLFKQCLPSLADDCAKISQAVEALCGKSEDEPLPDRLLNPNEYTPLISNDVEN